MYDHFPGTCTFEAFDKMLMTLYACVSPLCQVQGWGGHLTICLRT